MHNTLVTACLALLVNIKMWLAVISVKVVNQDHGKQRRGRQHARSVKLAIIVRVTVAQIASSALQALISPTEALPPATSAHRGSTPMSTELGAA